MTLSASEKVSPPDDGSRPADHGPGHVNPAPHLPAFPARTNPAGDGDAGPTSLREPRPSLLPDPRTTLLVLLVVNGIVLGFGDFAGVIVAGVVTTLMLATTGHERALRHVLAFAATFAAFAGLYLFLPSLVASTGAAVLVAIGFWCARFAVALGLGVYAVLTIRPTELTAALRAVKMPNFVVIPLAVVLRIIPVIFAEARAIGDAMTLRGLKPGIRSLVAHPIRSSSMLLIPLLSTVVRSGDELAASAMIRGLGGPARPTSITALSFRAIDAVLLIAATIIVAVSLGAVTLP